MKGKITLILMAALLVSALAAVGASATHRASPQMQIGAGIPVTVTSDWSDPANAQADIEAATGMVLTPGGYGTGYSTEITLWYANNHPDWYMVLQVTHEGDFWRAEVEAWPTAESFVYIVPVKLY